MVGGFIQRWFLCSSTSGGSIRDPFLDPAIPGPFNDSEEAVKAESSPAGHAKVRNLAGARIACQT